MDDYRMNPPILVPDITGGHTSGAHFVQVDPLLKQPESWCTVGSSEPSVHLCPVCDGNGLVPAGFYNQTSGGWSGGTLVPEQCRSCDGKGYIVVR